MDKQYLKKRHNVWWVRMRIPSGAKEIIGKNEFCKNLHTTDLYEANIKKHKEIASMLEEIEQAKRDQKAKSDKLSKEDQITRYSKKLRESKVSTDERFADPRIAKLEMLEGKLEQLYGSEEANAILHSDNPQWQGKEPDSLAKKNFMSAHKLTDQSYFNLSLLSKKFLDEEAMSIKKASFRRKQNHIEQFIKWTGDPDITKVSKMIVGEYINSIKMKRNPAYDTLRNIVADIRSLFSWAEGRGYLDRNPFYGIKLPKAEKGSQKRRAWTCEEILMFLKSSEIGKNEFTATVVSMYSGMRLDEICNIKKTNISENCFKVLEGKTEASQRDIPIHPELKPIIERFLDASVDDFLIKGIKSGGYDNKRSWNFQKKLTRLRKKLEMPKGVVFHTLRNTFATRMENLAIPTNHINQLMGHKHNNMSLDKYSAGLTIERLAESINKLTYGEEVDSCIKDSLKERSSFL